MRRFKYMAVFAALSIALAACGGNGGGGSEPSSSSSSGSKQLIDFKIAYGATSAVNIPITIAINDGIFKKHGLNVTRVLLPGTKTPPALASQSVALAQSGVSDLAGAIVAGSPITIVSIPYPYMFFRVFGQKGMKSLMDLKGKSIAASSPGSVSDTAINIAMQDTGLVRGKDYKVVYVGDNPARMAALEKGVVGAIVTSPPTAQLVEKKGYPDLNDMISKKIPYGYGGWGVNKEWASQHRDAVIKFMQAYAEALEIAKKDKEKAYEVMRSDLNLSDPDVLKSVYDVSIAVMDPYAPTDLNTIATTIKYSENEKVTKADPKIMFDNSYVEAAQSGAH